MKPMNGKNTGVTPGRHLPENAELLFSPAEVERAIDRMAAAITMRLREKNPLILVVMIGGVILAGKLIPRLGFPLQMDYIHATRYRGETRGGQFKCLKEPQKTLQGRTILLIDDILDEGITLTEIIQYCHAKGATEILTAVLANKEVGRDRPLKKADFSGVVVPDYYIIGYGMDYQEYYRNLDGIYVLKES